MPSAVREFLSRHRLVGPGVAAVSGGADSVALLLSLVESGASVTVGHVHHGLRGVDADGDQTFVQDLCGRLGVPFLTTRMDVTAAGGNWEAAARRLRYEWLAKLAADVGASWIATGHTADDQAETVLHRLLRGTGLHGLRGIAEVRGLPNPSVARAPQSPPVATGGLSLVRPLLTTTKSQLQHYLESHRQPFRTDATNFDPRYTRSRLRHDLLPKLIAARPTAVEDLGRIAAAATDAVKLFDTLAQQLLRRAERPRAGATVVFDAATLKSTDPVLVRDLFRLVWTREGWPANPMTAAHWHRLGTLTAGDYPGRIRLRVRGRVVQLGPAA